MTEHSECAWCGTPRAEDDSVQLRLCGHTTCEACAAPCRLCEDEEDGADG